MKYISTRGGEEPLGFSDVLIQGLAPDGGLYIPESWPHLDEAEWQSLAGRSYHELAFDLIRRFTGGTIPDADLQDIITQTYRGSFVHDAVAPLIQLGAQDWVMELFHGPTLSFKDYALQLLGRLFDYELKRRGERLTIIGATSGDTGSAAMAACAGCEAIDIFILFPNGRTSDVQRRQMTTYDAPNVHAIAVEGTFDDCQALVKDLFSDPEINTKRRLSAINSINWVRIVAQTVYYAAAALALGAQKRPVSFAVPTGNFGNIYAASIVRRMGLPIEALVMGTNRNDILTRFFETGKMEKGAVEPSLSPSMDIQVSSNFERYLCDLMGRDHAALGKLMAQFKDQGAFAVGDNLLKKAQQDFLACRTSDDETLATMRATYETSGVMLDPHTAVARHAALQAREKGSVKGALVSLACAHPAKFPEAVREATGKDPVQPERLAEVMSREEKYQTMSADQNEMRAFILENSQSE